MALFYIYVVAPLSTRGLLQPCPVFHSAIVCAESAARAHQRNIKFGWIPSSTFLSCFTYQYQHTGTSPVVFTLLCHRIPGSNATQLTSMLFFCVANQRFPKPWCACTPCSQMASRFLRGMKPSTPIQDRLRSFLSVLCALPGQAPVESVTVDGYVHPIDDPMPTHVGWMCRIHHHDACHRVGNSCLFCLCSSCRLLQLINTINTSRYVAAKQNSALASVCNSVNAQSALPSSSESVAPCMYVCMYALTRTSFYFAMMHDV